MVERSNRALRLFDRGSGRTTGGRTACDAGRFVPSRSRAPAGCGFACFLGIQTTPRRRTRSLAFPTTMRVWWRSLGAPLTTTDEPEPAEVLLPRPALAAARHVPHA